MTDTIDNLEKRFKAVGAGQPVADWIPLGKELSDYLVLLYHSGADYQLENCASQLATMITCLVTGLEILDKVTKEDWERRKRENKT